GLTAFFKYSSQGMGHGHFDRLSYSLYDETDEVLQDYGAARWVNIDQKGGGRYLHENNTFAKQSIAHNTAIINETSHFDASVAKGEAGKSVPWYFDNTPAVKVASAIDTQAYKGTTLQRTLFLIQNDQLPSPLLLDVFKVTTINKSKIDLPTWFMGHIMETNVMYKANNTNLKPIGESYGYEHIWEEARGKVNDN